MLLTSKNAININLSFDFVLFLLTSATSESSTENSCSWFPGRTKKSASHHQWWLFYANLVHFEDTTLCPDTSAYGAPSNHHPAALAPVLGRRSSCPNLRWGSSKHCPFSWPSHLRSFEQSADNLHEQSVYLLAVHLNPARLTSPSSEIIFYLLWIFCATQIHMFVTLRYIQALT